VARLAASLDRRNIAARVVSTRAVLHSVTGGGLVFSAMGRLPAVRNRPEEEKGKRRNESRTSDRTLDQGGRIFGASLVSLPDKV